MYAPLDTISRVLINPNCGVSYQEAVVSSLKTSLSIYAYPIFNGLFFFVMYLHIPVLLWPCAFVAATEFPELFTNAIGDISQSSTLTQTGSLANTTIPDNTTTELKEDMLMHCAKPLTWDAPSFHSEDCLGAIDYLFLETSLTECYSQLCQFYGKDTRTRIPKKNAQPTPRKYTFGKVISNGFAMTLPSLQNYHLPFDRCDIAETANLS